MLSGIAQSYLELPCITTPSEVLLCDAVEFNEESRVSSQSLSNISSLEDKPRI